MQKSEILDLLNEIGTKLEQLQHDIADVYRAVENAEEEETQEEVV
jgi:hypothetical protein